MTDDRRREPVTRVGIWCVHCPPRMNAGKGRWAVRDGRLLSFPTEDEALAEARRLRSTVVEPPNCWIFFPYPLFDRANHEAKRGD